MLISVFILGLWAVVVNVGTVAAVVGIESQIKLTRQSVGAAELNSSPVC